MYQVCKRCGKGFHPRQSCPARIWFVSAVTGEATIAATAYPTQLQKQQET